MEISQNVIEPVKDFLRKSEKVKTIAIYMLLCFAAISCKADKLYVYNTKDTTKTYPKVDSGLAKPKSMLEDGKKSKGLVCDSDVYDFGYIAISEAANLLCHFVLSNESDKVVNILKKESECGCTILKTSKDFIEPGEIIDVIVEVDWSSQDGQQEKTVWLKTDDPIQPRKPLTVKGFVVVNAKLMPKTIDFGLMMPGQQKTHTVKLIHGADKSAFKVVSIENKSKNFLIRRLNISETPSQCSEKECDDGSFEITFTAPDIGGEYDADIIFHTGIEGQERLILTVNASSRGQFVIEPSTLLFSNISDSNNLFRSVKIKSKTIKNIKPNTKVLWDKKQANPFFVEKTEQKKGGDFYAVITIGVLPEYIDTLLSQACLEITCGEAVLNVPIVAVKTRRQ